MRKKRTNTLHRHLSVQYRCGLFISLAGLLAILGWTVDSAALKSFAPGFEAMNPVTALNFLLFGSWLLFNSKANLKGVSHLTAFVLLANGFIIALKLIQILYPAGLHIDNLLFSQLVGTNKIAPATMLGFVLLTGAFFISRFNFKNKEYIFQALVITNISISSICLLGYIFNLSSLITASALSPMPLITCICFIVLSVGLMFSYHDKGYMRPFMSKKLGGIIARKLFPFIILVPVITGTLCIAGQHFNLYNTASGVAIQVVATAFLSYILSYYFAKKINEMDAARKLHEAELAEKSNQLYKSEILLEQTAEIAKAGGWEITIPGKMLSGTPELFKIREMNHNPEALESQSDLYNSQFGSAFLDRLDQVLTDGKPFEIETKIVTAKEREIWVKIKASTVLNDKGVVVALGGTLQDIDDFKKKELLLEESLKIISEQNKRLMNLLPTLPHNHETDAGNINNTLSIYEEEEPPEDKVIVLEMPKRAAHSLAKR